MIPLLLLSFHTSFLDFNRDMDMMPEDEVVVISDGYHFEVGFMWDGDWHTLSPVSKAPIGWRILDEDR